MADRNNPSRQLLLAAAVFAGSLVALTPQNPQVAPSEVAPKKRPEAPRTSRALERLPLRAVRTPPRPQRQPSHKNATTGHDWSGVAACESSGDWQANTGNGYMGGLQMDAAFWANYGGLRFAARPDLATREQQITVAERGLAVQGWGAWPVCQREAA